MSQHKAIDLTGTSTASIRFKRKITPEEHRFQKASNRAMEALLADRLFKAQKTESSDKKDDSTSSGLQPRTVIETPDFEWWDKQVFMNPEHITHLVEHPIPILGILGRQNKHDETEQKVMLTEEERRKLKKLRNQEKVREFQDKIKMGLIPPPPPKIKMKNLMCVLGSGQVAEPSAIEQSVRAQVDQRLADHIRRNEERKLTPEARREKIMAKWTNDDSLHVSVFLVTGNVTNKIKFKINKSGEELHLGGFFLNSQSREPRAPVSSSLPSIIVAMGSRKGIKRFDKTLLRRINWIAGDTSMDAPEDEADDDDDDETQSPECQGCRRIFHGTQPLDSKLPRWSYLVIKDEATARSFLSEKKSMHFWDMALRFRDDKLDV